MPAKYQVYRDVDGKYRFRLRAENNKIVAVSQAYERHADCLDGVKSVQNNCTVAIEDMTEEGKRIPNPKYQVFFDAKCGYRFHLNASNGEIIAASEGYETKEGCLNGIQAVQKSCNAEIEDLTVTQKPESTTIEEQMPAEGPVPVVETKMAPSVGIVEPSVGIVEAKLELFKLPEKATRGEIVHFQGKLSRSDTGEGIPNARLQIREHDRSFLLDEILERCYTAEDGSFNIGWKARSIDWWDNSGEYYAQFDGDNRAKKVRSNIQKMVIVK